MAQSMFERYGGFSVVSRIVSSFYDRVLDSDNLAPYFEGTDMRRQIDHQSKFISSLMGGPASYSNDQLERSHERLNCQSRSKYTPYPGVKRDHFAVIDSSVMAT